MKSEKKGERLFSLDALRGLDMLFLCVVQPLIAAAAKGFGFKDHPFMRQFNHYWGGFTAYDLIMPLFIFMCGAAIPFALPKRLDERGRPTAAFWRHVLARVALLWFLGMVAQGRLLTYDPAKFVYFSNTLQSIAVGYLIASLVFLVKRRWVRIAAPFALALAYGLALHFLGDYSEKGNFAMKVDMLFVNVLQPVCGHDTGSYTWYFTSLMFGAMTLCGLHATLILKSDRTSLRKAGLLAAVGAAEWVGGLLLELAGVPCIKQIYTVSFTAQAMGLSTLLLAALYVINDIGRFRRGWGLVLLYGQFALVAYMVGESLRYALNTTSWMLIGGLAKRIGMPWQDIIIQLGLAAVLTFFLVLWRGWRRSRREGAPK